jgi:hypothetical protein
MSNGKYIGVVASGSDISSYFSILDKDMKEVGRFGYVPFLENLKGLNLRRLNGSMTSSQTQFVFAAMNYGYLVSYEITEENEVNKKWEYYLSDPYYKIENGEVKWEEDNNRMGFYDIKMNSKYIFALYHGDEISHMLETDSTPKHLLVFDLNGHLIKLFELDRQCVRIAVTEENTVFAGSVEFDSEIVRYDLSKYL